MKYIVLARDLAPGRRQELPFIFPEDMSHGDVAIVLRALFQGVDTHVVSAGEVLFNSAPCCFGRSTSLDKFSRNQFDEYLMQSHDYQHGLIGNEQTPEPTNG